MGRAPGAGPAARPSPGARFLRCFRARVAAFAASAILSACGVSTDVSREDAAAPAASDGAVYVVHHGWHADLVIARAALLARGAPPEAATFPDAALLEFGWGDRAYYMAADRSAWLAIRAALTPTSAVLRVAPLARPPAAADGLDVVRLDLPKPKLDRLVGAISAACDRADHSPARPLADGLASGARFHAATDAFHLFNTWQQLGSCGSLRAARRRNPHLRMGALLSQLL
jgi:Protein of unknown function (DUF2459).